MSIYGPPPREPRRRSGRPLIHVVRLVVVILAVTAMSCIGVLALLGFQRHDASEQLEIQRADTIRLDSARMFEATPLQTADLLPPIPRPPHIEIPAPLQRQSAEILPSGATREKPPPLQSAEILR